MVIRPIDLEYKKERKLSWRKGTFGQLKEANFGSNNPTGICKLIIGGVTLDELTFRNTKERQDIFKFWGRRYLIIPIDESFIEVSYYTLNIKDRSAKYIR